MTESNCALCEKPITGTRRELKSRSTGRVCTFHEDCAQKIFEGRRARAAEDIAERFERCALGPDGFDAQLPTWPYARFDNAAFRQLASPTILAALEPWKPTDGNLVLSARTGAGKTAGTVALLHRLRSDAERACDLRILPRFLFVTAALLGGARRQQRLGTGESRLIEHAMDSELLVLDEIGFEALDGVSFELIDTRYRKQRTTVITTGLPPADFAQRYGSAVWRRLTEAGAVVEDHPSKLKVAAR